MILNICIMYRTSRLPRRAFGSWQYDTFTL